MNNINKTKNVQTKNFTLQNAEIKDFENSKFGYISGIANQVGVLDHHNDIIISGAFEKTVKNNPVVLALWGHDHNKVMGTSNLSLTKDGSLKVEMKINKDVQIGKETHSLASSMLEAGRPLEFSIGYLVGKSSEGVVDGNTKVRYLEEVEVIEVSVVSIGANSESRATDVKKLQDVAPEEKSKALDLEKAKLKAKLTKFINLKGDK